MALSWGWGRFRGRGGSHACSPNEAGGGHWAMKRKNGCWRKGLASGSEGRKNWSKKPEQGGNENSCLKFEPQNGSIFAGQSMTRCVCCLSCFIMLHHQSTRLQPGIRFTESRMRGRLRMLRDGTASPSCNLASLQQGNIA